MSGEVETSSSPIRRQASDVKYPEKVESRPDRIPDVRYPEKVESRPDRIPDVRYPKKVEHRKGDHLRVQGVGTPPPDDTERASLSGATPSGFPKRTRGALPYPEQLHPDSPRGHATRFPIRSNSIRKKHMALVNITPWTIVYPIRICCPDH